MNPSRRNPVPNRGYTVVELMMGLVVFAIGVTGVAAMQKVTSSTNGHAKNLATATAIAQSWQDQLAVDATRWGQNGAATPLAGTLWLNQIGANDNTWILPAAALNPVFGPAFDALGRHTTVAAETVFCTHVRLTELIAAQGSRLIRTEVRVFWPRQGQGLAGNAAYCVNAQVAAVASQTDAFHFIYKTSAVRQTPGFGG